MHVTALTRSHDRRISASRFSKWMPMRISLSVIVLAASTVASAARAQAAVDPALARYIAGIRAIDNHAHPMRPVPDGAPADTDFDALPLDGIPAFDLPNRLK